MVLLFLIVLTEIDFAPNKETLFKLIARGSALKLKVNQTGVDLLIPAFKDRVIFGVLLVQVKNKKRTIIENLNWKICTSETPLVIKSDLCGLNAIGIYITLRDKRCRSKTTHYTSTSYQRTNTKTVERNPT